MIYDGTAKCAGVYDNPIDMNAKAWTVMWFNEVEENDRLEWLIREDIVCIVLNLDV